ncbi:MAG: hypothetical protein JNK89_06565, partial [Saprospiraceae bacterium]|nr:hypothetical protein [Saprospiraceae bacterium]
MKVCYFWLVCIVTCLALSAHAQPPCPPPGFPSPGNSCPTAPILCENLDGYCTTINNTNVVQPFPGCPGWQLNNDEWFGFFAGSTTITIEITPSNCTQGPNMGLQGAIYAGCGPPWVVMDAQCSCTQNPFELTSNNFVIGQVYYIVMDGCAGNVCDLSIEVTEGSTVSIPPADPGPMSGPLVACQGQTTNYSIAPVNAATLYLWALNPSSGGTITNNGPNASVTWGNTPGPVEICVNPANLCDTNFTTSCLTVEVQPKPTANISGSGFFCFGDPEPVDLTVTFTGDPDWRFVYTINGVAQPPIVTSDNPYILTVTQPGTYALQSVAGVTGNCPGMVSGSVVLSEIKLTPTAAVTNAVCGNSNGAINLSVSGGNTPYQFQWSSGETTEDLSNIPPGMYTVTITDANGCTEDLTVQVPDNPITITLNGTVVHNTTCLPPGNGSITTTVSPTGSYTYEWSNGETTPNLSNLPPGTYDLTVTLGVNCTQTASFTIN